MVKPTKAPTNSGFVTDYQYTLSWEETSGWKIYPGSKPDGIMAIHTPETLPILSTLAKEYAVCDRWFCSVPSETQPNRAFIHMATSEGLIKNNWNHEFTSKSIYTALEEAGASWSIYSYDYSGLSKTRFDIRDIKYASSSHFGVFDEFKEAVANDNLANYVFLEPAWGSTGNSMHPNYNAANAEQFLKEIYQTLVDSPVWEKTLLIITFDEHGGCYDHVAPPANAVQPDEYVANNGFDFTRYGVRVPTVLVSPYIKKGTIHRVPEPDNYQPGTGEQPLLEPTPFDHTSILRTVEMRFGAKPLTKRDASAQHIADVLTLDTARTEDVLANVPAPVAELPPGEESTQPSKFQTAIATQVSNHFDPAEKYGSRPFESYTFKDGDEMMQWAKERWDRHYEYWKKNEEKGKE